MSSGAFDKNSFQVDGCSKQRSASTASLTQITSKLNALSIESGSSLTSLSLPEIKSHVQTEKEDELHSSAMEISSAEFEQEITFLVNKLEIEEPKPEQLHFMPYIY